MSWNIKDFILEVINEEQLDEKLMVYNNRKPYGQVVFFAGGAGSGKGFALKNFIDKEAFKVRDVDKMKQKLQILNRMGKVDIDGILKKYGKKMPQTDIENIRSIQSQGFKLRNLNLKQPNHVSALHALVKAMGLKDKTLEKLLVGKSNPETLPNILFDITMKKVSDITGVIPKLQEVGYKSENIHLTWILANFVTAMERNKTRDRMVPEKTLLKTHEGAANTVWGLVTKAMPKGLNGRVDVILNNDEHTIRYDHPTEVDAEGKPKKVEGIAKGFLSLPVKKEGGSILPEKVWQNKLYNWIKNNAPDTITQYM